MAKSNQKILVVNKRMLGSVQNNIECKVASADQKVMGLLLSSAKVEVTSCEPLQKEANVSGKIIIDILYKTENDEIDSTSSAFAFSSKVEGDFEPNLGVVATAEIVDYSVDGVSEDEVRFVVTTEVRVLGYPQTEFDVAEADEDLCVKMSENHATRLTKSSNQKLSDILCFDIKDKVKKVLRVDVQTICKDAQAGNGYVTLNGEDIVDILYVEDDVEPKLKSASFVQPFGEELEVGGVTKDSLIDQFVSVKYDALSNTLEQGEDGAKININREANVQIFAFEKFEFESIEDVYSLSHTTLVSTNSYNYLAPQKQMYFQNKIDGSVTAGENTPRIDKVLENSANTLKVLAYYVQDDEIIIQGTMQTTVLYLNDENSTIESLEVEIPFEVKQRIEEIPGALIDVKCAVDGVDVVAKRGKDIFIEAEVKTYVAVYSTETGAAISGIELQDELPPKTSAMEIYFANAGQTLWDVAKDMVESVDTLAKFNPDLPEVMAGDEKIICYRKKSV